MTGGLARGLAVLAVLLSSRLAQAAELPEVDLKEGLWRLSVEMILPGRGPETGPLTHEICLRPNEVSRLIVPPNTPCSVSDVSASRHRIRWKIACQQGVMRSAGEGLIEFAGSNFTSVMIVKTAQPHAMEIRQTILGKRLGKCPPDTTPGGVPLKKYP